VTTDPALLVSLASTGTVTIALVAAAGLKAWEGWLEIKRLEAERGERGRRVAPRAPTSTRFELADLRERIRRLEAIANGSEL
jgi:hypothetical protein